MKKSKDRPYVLFVAEVIYKNIVNIKNKNPELSSKLTLYFEKYNNFCFDIVNKNMIKEIIKFEY